MVAGADTMLDVVSNYGNKVILRVFPRKEESHRLNKHFIHLVKIQSSLTSGATYMCKNSIIGFKDKIIDRTLWLCPVTLYVFGHYPNHIYFKPI